MSITPGTRIGSYEITTPLGKGGMGEVNRARDTKLKREVAIKILPDEFSRDADRVSRFQREAEVVASLSLRILLVSTVSKKPKGHAFLFLNSSRAKPWRNASSEG